MKKRILAMVIGMSMLALTACGSTAVTDSGSSASAAASTAGAESSTAAAETAESVYELYNRTGDDLTEVFIYEAGSSDKGENLSDQFHGGHAHIDKGQLPTGVDFILEFTTAGGYTAKFETLHAEVAPITLLAEDALTGPTVIAFQYPVEPAQYEVHNRTGEAVTELYIYEVGSADKGTNFADGGMDADAKVDIDYGDQSVEIKYTIEYTTESGRNAQFDTLSVEVAPIYLLSEDAMTGASPISFMEP